MRLEKGELYWMQRVYGDGSRTAWCIVRIINADPKKIEADMVYEPHRGAGAGLADVRVLVNVQHIPRPGLSQSEPMEVVK